MADVLSETGVWIGVPMRLRLSLVLTSIALLAAALAPAAQANLRRTFHLKTGMPVSTWNCCAAASLPA